MHLTDADSMAYIQAPLVGFFHVQKVWETEKVDFPRWPSGWCSEMKASGRLFPAKLRSALHYTYSYRSPSILFNNIQLSGLLACSNRALTNSFRLVDRLNLRLSSNATVHRDLSIGVLNESNTTNSVILSLLECYCCAKSMRNSTGWAQNHGNWCRWEKIPCSLAAWHETTNDHGNWRLRKRYCICVEDVQ